MLPSDSLRCRFDVAVIGGGLAGLTAALNLADAKTVLLVCKKDLLTSASSRAQGGISAVFTEPDSHEKHLEDTLIAGDLLNDIAASRFIIENSRQAVDWLIERGVPFTRKNGEYHLTREGGHSERRILHVDDLTGKAIQDILAEQVRRHPNITVLEHHAAVRLLGAQGDARACAGVLLVDENGVQKEVAADFTVLATGGAGQIFLHATAPGASTGDGIALAWNFGCRVANLEFLQFHPTCMYYPQGEPFLITEAVRGEGGLLRLPDGRRFMPEYDPRAELAPRDLVARAIYSEMKKHGIPAVHLDISHRPPAFVKEHFPNIYRQCMERGIDITREPIPVTPASHYTCGGVVTDIRGRTDAARLYCIGESACTGFHGANRLASNSLLECVVVGKAAAMDILASAKTDVMPATESPALPPLRRLDERERHAIDLARNELRRLMWEYVGIVRDFASLEAAGRRIRLLEDEAARLYGTALPETALIELRNLLTTAKLVVDCARSRQESRGCHFNRDCPKTGPAPVPTILTPSVAEPSCL
ncbi:L-aspartate oxidase [Herbaspirillum sp. HC18]|nr:L-aspartate oxidase [Herbaspirillum sp. HC18]